MKRYDLMIAQDRIDAIQGQYVYLVSDVEATMIPKPDPEEARKAIAKVKRLVKTQCKPCRRHGLTEEIAEAEAALLRLMGVEV